VGGDAGSGRTAPDEPEGHVVWVGEDEELLLGSPGPFRPSTRRWWVVGAVLVAGVLTWAAVAQPFAHHPARHAASTTSGSTTSASTTSASATASASAASTAAVIDTIDVIGPQPSSSAADVFVSAAGALSAGPPLSMPGPHGSTIWMLEITNISGNPVRPSGPLHVHVASALRAKVENVQLLDGTSPVSSDTDINQDRTVQLRVQLSFDCAHIDRTAPFPDTPVAVDIMLFGFDGTATFYLGPALDETVTQPSWQQVCAQR
jgi:hypothetical protein